MQDEPPRASPPPPLSPAQEPTAHGRQHTQTWPPPRPAPPPPDERALVRSLLASLSGADSDALTSSPSSCGGWGGYELAGGAAGAAPGDAALLLALSDVGWLHARVRAAAADDDDDSSDHSAVRRALRAALRAELAPILAAVAGLEDAAAAPLPPSWGAGGAYLSLRRAAALLLPLRDRLLTLARLADASTGVGGGRIAAALARAAPGGDAEAAATAARVVTAAAAPVLAATWRWVLDGRLNDASDGFIVAADPPPTAEGAAWRRGWSIDVGAIPPSLSRHAAAPPAALRAGKTAAWLASVGDDWASSEERGRLAVAATRVAPGDGDAAATLIARADATLGARALAVALRGAGVLDAVDAVAAYLLGGRGDVWTEWVARAGGALDGRAASVSPLDLTSALEDALAAVGAPPGGVPPPSTGGPPCASIVAAIDAGAAGGGECGWDAVALTLAPSRAPAAAGAAAALRTLLPPSSAASLAAAARLAWKLGRAERALAIAHRDVRAARRCAVRVAAAARAPPRAAAPPNPDAPRPLARPPAPRLAPAALGLELRALGALTAAAAARVSALRSGFAYSGVHPSFATYTAAAAAATDLDALTAAVDGAVAALTDRLLLRPGDDTAAAAVTSFLTSASRLAPLAARLAAAADRAAADAEAGWAPDAAAVALTAAVGDVAEGRRSAAREVASRWASVSDAVAGAQRETAFDGAVVNVI